MSFPQEQTTGGMSVASSSSVIRDDQTRDDWSIAL